MFWLAVCVSGLQIIYIWLSIMAPKSMPQNHGGAARDGERTVVKTEFVPLSKLEAQGYDLVDILRLLSPADIREDAAGRLCYRVITVLQIETAETA